MITKVLIAEDHELANVSVQKTLEELGVRDIDYAFYCDDALVKIQNSKLSGQPYDLLITDLHFENDGIQQQVTDGISLIEASQQLLPAMKIIVFSVENKPATIESLFELQNIDGYVRKSRNDGKELRLALEAIKQHQRYFPRHLTQSINRKNAYQFTDFDIEIISLLANGVSQKNIPSFLLQKGIRPSSLSSVEKRLNHIKVELDCAKNEQLVAFCKDMGII
jgi:DNA-binding NarL/FixJ family response regulator